MARLGYKKVENVPSYYGNIVSYPNKDEKNSTGAVGMTNMYFNTNESSEENVLRQNKQILDYYGNESANCAFHFVLEFSPEELAYLNDQRLLEIGYRFAINEFSKYATYFGIHDHSQCKHIDMVVFITNIYDGSSYSLSKRGSYKLMKDLVAIMEQYMPKEVISWEQLYQMQ